MKTVYLTLVAILFRATDDMKRDILAGITTQTCACHKKCFYGRDWGSYMSKYVISHGELGKIFIVSKATNKEIFRWLATRFNYMHHSVRLHDCMAVSEGVELTFLQHGSMEYNLDIQ